MKSFTGVLFFVFMSVIGFSQAQMANFYYEKGKELYDEKEYEDAVDEFRSALEKDENHNNSLNYLGQSLIELGKSAEALEVFNKLDKAAEQDYWPWYLYLKGNLNSDLENWQTAVKDYDKFMEKYSKDADRIGFHHCAAYKKHYALNVEKVRAKKSNMSEPVNLGSEVNTISDDMMPQIDPKGNRLYFTSTRQGGFDKIDKDEPKDYGEDLYYSVKQNNTWSPAVLLPQPINTEDNDGAATFSADGQQMIYGKCGEEDGVGSCDLYICSLEGDKWSVPSNLGDVVNSEDWDAQPSLSADGLTLAFVSTRGGSYDGSMDIYITRKNKFGQWGVPQNAGTTVNTPFGEKSPFLAPDGKTMYFSSEGHPGFGDYDVFVSVWEVGKWSEPTNLGAPLNSKGIDTYFTISASGEEAFFASDRSGVGLLDLFSVEIPKNLRPKPSVIISGVVTNAKSEQKIGAWVLVEDINTGELMATAKSNAISGEYLVVLPSGRNYSVSANKEGYFFYSNKFEVPKNAKYEEITKDITLNPIEKGARVVLNNIFFETGSAILSQESYIELGKAVDLLNANKNMVVEIGGHTDNVGSDDSNMKLSHDRAKSVRNYLVKAGIISERLQAKGYGETQPVAGNETDEGKKTNRRTEFVILEN